MGVKTKLLEVIKSLPGLRKNSEGKVRVVRVDYPAMPRNRKNLDGFHISPETGRGKEEMYQEAREILEFLNIKLPGEESETPWEE